MLGDKAYVSAELRNWLGQRGTTAVIPNKCNRKKPFRFNKQAYKQRHCIEKRLLRAQRLPQDRHSLRQAREKLPRIRLPHCSYRLVDLMSLDPSSPTRAR